MWGPVNAYPVWAGLTSDSNEHSLPFGSLCERLIIKMFKCSRREGRRSYWRGTYGAYSKARGTLLKHDEGEGCSPVSVIGLVQREREREREELDVPQFTPNRRKVMREETANCVGTCSLKLETQRA